VVAPLLASFLFALRIRYVTRIHLIPLVLLSWSSECPKDKEGHTHYSTETDVFDYLTHDFFLVGSRLTNSLTASRAESREEYSRPRPTVMISPVLSTCRMLY
jgi:hypothetical protein